MRASTCIACQRYRATEIGAYVLAADPIAHHHHIAVCTGCGAAWFDDITVSAFGVLAARTDTEPCTCPPSRWRRAVMFAACPESACRCGPGMLDAEGTAA